MPANTSPVFPLTPVVTGAVLTTGNTSKDLTTGASALLYTAGPDGSRLDRVRARSLGTNVATVLRIFLNNGSAPSVAANNLLWAEVSLPATTNSETAAITGGTQELPNTNLIPDSTAFPLVLPAGWRVYATIGTTVAAGWVVTAAGGNF